MIRYWQSAHEYHCFFNNAKATFDSSERVRLQTELSEPREKLRLLDTDAAILQRMINRRRAIRLKMHYTRVEFIALCKTIFEGGGSSYFMLAGIFPIRPDRKEILFYQAVMSGGASLL